MQMSYDRILPLVDPKNILVVTNSTYYDQVREQLPELESDQILLGKAQHRSLHSLGGISHRSTRS